MPSIKPADRQRIISDLDLVNSDPRCVTFHADGTVSYRRSYYFGSQIPGGSMEGMAGLLRDRASACGHTFEVVRQKDQWQQWPKDSYVVIRFRVGLDALRATRQNKETQTDGRQ